MHPPLPAEVLTHGCHWAEVDIHGAHMESSSSHSPVALPCNWQTPSPHSLKSTLQHSKCNTSYHSRTIYCLSLGSKDKHSEVKKCQICTCLFHFPSTHLFASIMVQLITCSGIMFLQGAHSRAHKGCMPCLIWGTTKISSPISSVHFIHLQKG